MLFQDQKFDICQVINYFKTKVTHKVVLDRIVIFSASKLKLFYIYFAKICGCMLFHNLSGFFLRIEKITIRWIAQ